MKITKVNPASMGGEPGAYTNGVGVESPGMTLYISGQIGIDAKGVAAPDFGSQCRQAWRNVGDILADAGMDYTNIVKTTIFLVDPKDYAEFAEIRKSVLQGHKPASTLVYVSGLVKPDWKVEIEAVAVR